eukprot:2509545-Karenia_brevis.AAC.1
MASYNDAASRSPRRQADRTAASQEEAKLQAATALVERGELSHAARVLRSTGLAPGNQHTLQELRNPELRPQILHDDLPNDILQHQPAEEVQLDRQIFTQVLQQARKGLSAGLGGT